MQSIARFCAVAFASVVPGKLTFELSTNVSVDHQARPSTLGGVLA